MSIDIIRSTSTLRHLKVLFCNGLIFAILRCRQSEYVSIPQSSASSCKNHPRRKSNILNDTRYKSIGKFIWIIRLGISILKAFLERKNTMSVLKVIDRIQELSPCAAVRYRIKRILKQQIDSELFDEFYNSKWVDLLKTNQHNDGGYGRFHTQNTKIKQKYPTTENAINAIKMLDIQRGNQLINSLCNYMENILKNEIVWPDRYEVNKWYRPAQPLFVSSKLSIFGSYIKEFNEIFDCWHIILKEAFANGDYSADRTNKISKELLGCDIDGSYIGLNSLYLIEFYGNMQAKIEDGLKSNYLRWLHKSNKKVPYTNFSFSLGYKNSFSELYRVYFLLSKYSCFKTEFEEELCCLKDKRTSEGFWNFGKSFSCQKLSDDWRSQDKMNIDHTIMALLLLA